MRQLRITVNTRQQLGQIFYLLTEHNLLPRVVTIEGIVEQLIVWVDQDSLADQIVDQLSDYEFVTEVEVYPLWPTNGRYDTDPVMSRLRIIETSIGPMISDSRSSVYDVMEAYDDGNSIEEICTTFNLYDSQVKIAIDYIEEHRDRLEPELREILIKKTENEKYHRAIAAEIERNKSVDNSPRRQRVRAAIAEYRRKWGIADADYSQ